jgi:deoxyribonucleoside regulator
MPSDMPSGPMISEGKLLADERFLRRVASLYYEDGHSQEAIAEMEACSRQTISKALQKAKERGIVRITIVPELRAGYLRNLSREVRVRLGLEDLILVAGRNLDERPDEVLLDDVVAEITSAAADYLDQLLTNADILAVSGGKTFMRNVVRYLKPTKLLPNLEVVSTIGFVEPRTNFGDANLIAYDIAQAYGGKHTWFAGPAIIVHIEEIQQVPEFPIVLSSAKDLMDRANVVMMGLWTPNTNDEVVMRGILSREQMAVIESYHPAADINHWVFDAQGRCINEMLKPPPYTVTGLEIPSLKDRIRKNGTKVILVAGGGKTYVPAIRAVLKAGIVNILVTDHVTAQLLLGSE